MDIEIYGDQDGNKIFPTISSEKDEKIKRFFSNSVDLHIEKKGDKLAIICHIIARKGLERYQGYYIKYINNYNGSYFTNFKRDADKILNNLELRPSGDIQNTIFDNIQKFDLEGRHREDINIIKYTLDNENLDYKAGKINDISIFCNDILKNINNVKIVISSEESKLGNINILRTKFEESLNPSDNTIQILDKYRQKIIDEKNKIEKERARDKIAEGFRLMNDGVGTLKKYGQGDEWKEIIIEGTNTLIGKPLIEKDKDKEKDEDKKGTNVSYILVGVMFLFGIVIGIIASPYLNTIIEKYSGREPVPAPTETSVPTSTETSVPTPTGTTGTIGTPVPTPTGTTGTPVPTPTGTR